MTVKKNKETTKEQALSIEKAWLISRSKAFLRESIISI